MHGERVTTPFGRRPMTLALLRRQATASKVSRGKSANKWKIFRDVSEAKAVLDLQDRSLAVLDALLSFYPDNDLKDDSKLVVFPSNAQLALRAHGIAGATLRRHLASLIDAGLILRRDSANGKRYAHRGRGGEIEDAFGFDLSPLLVRAEELATIAESVVAERTALRRARESLTICRRDVRKLIRLAVDEGIEGEWEALQEACTTLLGQLTRSSTVNDINHVLNGLGLVQARILNTLKSHEESESLSSNDAHSEHHIQSSNTESQFEYEATSPWKSTVNDPVPRYPADPLPLGIVLKACTNMIAYGPGGTIASWKDLRSAAIVVRSMLGITAATFEDACQTMGSENAAIAIACILERGQHIHSAGGYLRDLTHRAARREFSTAPMLMALLRAKMADVPPADAGLSSIGLALAKPNKAFGIASVRGRLGVG